MGQSSVATGCRQTEDGVFKHLLIKLSYNMTEKDAESLLFMAGHKLPKNVDNKQLGALSLLWERSVISPRSCANLHSYYESIYRNDLANLVLRYMQENHDVEAEGRSMHVPVDAELPEEVCSCHTVREPSAEQQNVSLRSRSLSDTSHIAATHHSSEDDGGNGELSAATTAELTGHGSPHSLLVGSVPDVHQPLQFTEFSGNSHILGSQEVLVNQCNAVSFQSLPSQSSPNSQVAPGTEISISLGDLIDIRVKTPKSSSSVSPPHLHNTDAVGVTPNKAPPLRRAGNKLGRASSAIGLRYSTLHETRTPDENSEGHDSQVQKEELRNEWSEEKQSDKGEEKRGVEGKEVKGVGGQGERRERKEKQEKREPSLAASDPDATSNTSTPTLSTKIPPPLAKHREVMEGMYNKLFFEKINFTYLQSIQKEKAS